MFQDYVCGPEIYILPTTYKPFQQGLTTSPYRTEDRRNYLLIPTFALYSSFNIHLKYVGHLYLWKYPATLSHGDSRLVRGVLPGVPYHREIVE